MESPWVTQESGARGQRVDARAGGSDGQKSPSAMADEAGTWGRHGAWQEQRAKNGGRRDWEEAEPSGVGGNFGGREASGVDPKTHVVGGDEGGCKAFGVEENPKGGRHRVGGGSRVLSGGLDPQRNGRGSRVVPGGLDSQWGGRGSRVVPGRLEPQRGRGTQGRQNPGSPHSVPLLTGGGRTGAEGRGRKPTHRPSNQGARARWRRRRGATQQDGGARQGDGDGGGRRRRGVPAQAL